MALVDFAQQSLRTRGRAVTDVANHGSVLLFEHQAREIQGLRFDDYGADGDDEIWLSVPRPPIPAVPPQAESPWLSPWLNVGTAVRAAPQLATEIDGAALIAAAGLFTFFRYTLTGKAIRAYADNYLGAKVVGLNVKHLYALTFGLGAMCVAIAGCAMVVLVDVTPPLGPAYTLLAFVIVIVGGLGSMGGALLGGVLIGVSEALAGLFIEPSAKSMFSFGLLILVLLFRPQGLLGRHA